VRSFEDLQDLAGVLVVKAFGAFEIKIHAASRLLQQPLP